MARILIVEDERDTADTYAALAKLWGHEVRKAFDGQSVVQQAIAFSPDLVMLDIGFPAINWQYIRQRDVA